MSDDSPWLPLSKAASLCEAAGVPLNTLNDLLKSGRVPGRGKRRFDARAEPIEDLLRRVEDLRRASVVFPNSISFRHAQNHISLYLDSLTPAHRKIAVELNESRGLHDIRGGYDYRFAIVDWNITFVDVVVHWPTCVEELQAWGFQIRPAPKPGKEPPCALPRPTLQIQELQAWYEKRIKEFKLKGHRTSEAEDWEAAKAEFGERVRREALRQVRRNLAPSDWRRQGRRSKSNWRPKAAK